MNAIIVTNAKPGEVAELVKQMKESDNSADQKGVSSVSVFEDGSKWGTLIGLKDERAEFIPL